MDLIEFSNELNNNPKLLNGITIYGQDFLKKFLTKNDVEIVIKIFSSNISETNDLAKKILLQGYNEQLKSKKITEINKFDKELSAAEVFITDNPKLNNVLQDNYYKDKLSLLKKTLNNQKFSQLTLNTIEKIFDNRGITFNDVRKIIGKYKNTNVVKVFVPYELTIAQQKKLKSFLIKKFNEKNIELALRIDESILAGFRATLNSRTYNSALML